MSRLLFPTMLALASLLFFACGPTVSTLPSSSGGLDEVVVMEDFRYKDGSMLKTLSDEMQSKTNMLLLVPETRFDVLYTTIATFNIYKKHRNLVLVAVLDTANEHNELVRSLIGLEKLKPVLTTDKLYYLERANVWASGQTVRILVARNEEALRAGMASGVERLMTSIDQGEAVKFHNFVFGIGREYQMEKELREQHDLKIKIPEKFKLQSVSAKKKNFYFLRKRTIDYDAQIMLYYLPYTSADMVSAEFAIAVRDSLGKYEGSTVPGSYMATEDKLPPLVDTVDLNGYFAIRNQGLWMLENDFMGGVFVNYWVYDEKNQRMVYLDGYLSAQNMKKRKILKEMDAILRTFGLPNEPNS